MNKEVIIRLLTGAMAAGIRRALLALSGVLGANAIETAPDGTSTTFDSAQIGLALATFIVPAVWSYIEKRMKAQQSATALIQVAAGSTLKDAMNDTTALKAVTKQIESEVGPIPAKEPFPVTKTDTSTDVSK